MGSDQQKDVNSIGRRCNAIGCSMSVPVLAAHELMCSYHWGLVPPDIQKKVSRAFISDKEIGYPVAAQLAIDSVRRLTHSGDGWQPMTKDEAQAKFEDMVDMPAGIAAAADLNKK